MVHSLIDPPFIDFSMEALIDYEFFKRLEGAIVSLDFVNTNSNFTKKRRSIINSIYK
jgi:hypothetical protein